MSYFRDEFVARRRWITESAFAEFIALTQLLPGPSSSQTGFLIGITRGGIPGGIAAWTGFTLPSAVLMVLFAIGVGHARGPFLAGGLHGLQIAAVAVVGNAVAAMFRKLCPDLPRALLAIATALFVFWAGGSWSQIAAIAAGALAGSLFHRRMPNEAIEDDVLRVSKWEGRLAIGIFVALGILLAVARIDLLNAFYRTGALVFGGGHVVLPLLQQAVVRPGWVVESDFLAGYGAAQTVPGPLFTFAAYLGYVSRVAPNGYAGALLCLLSIFLPGILLAVGTARTWQRVRSAARFRAMLAGVNAVVVGLLLSALIHSATAGAIGSVFDGALAVVGFALLIRTRVSPVIVVLSTAVVTSIRAVVVG